MGNFNIEVNPQWLTLSCVDISQASPICAIRKWRCPYLMGNYIIDVKPKWLILSCCNISQAAPILLGCAKCKYHVHIRWEMTLSNNSRFSCDGFSQVEPILIGRSEAPAMTPTSDGQLHSWSQPALGDCFLLSYFASRADWRLAAQNTSDGAHVWWAMTL